MGACASGFGWWRVAATALMAVIVGVTGVTPAGADVPYPAPPAGTDPADYPAYTHVVGPEGLPEEYDHDDYKSSSKQSDNPALRDHPQQLDGVIGPSLDRAWETTTGRPDVLIAVLDSGIMWRDDDMADLARKAHVNLGEAVPPCGVGSRGDCSGDGVFNIADFGDVADRNANGLADPEDLILDPAFSDGVDDDANGYVDDISGWDFLYGDNDPLDEVNYGHGTGEAQDSAAEAGNGHGVGTCPNCMFLPVRVGDSFITEAQRFAAGVLFALDSGAHVVQEALGLLTNTTQTQQAVDAAYDRGVPVVASMADEASKHPNLPVNLERTMAVNSITDTESELLAPEQYLSLNGCTNYGGHIFVSVPSDGCSSEATGRSSGMMGLLQSAARDAVATGGLASYGDLAGDPRVRNPISANEAYQVFRASADDIDFSTPEPGHPETANNFFVGALLDFLRTTTRYPSTKGWDATHGYGRVNARRMVEMVRAGVVPPEAEIDTPLWFDYLPVSGAVPVTGRVAALRSGSYSYRVEWTPGLQAPPYPGGDTWHAVGEAHGLTAPVEGTLATLDLADVARVLPGGGAGAPLTPDGRPDEERFSVRIRVVVTTGDAVDCEGARAAACGVDQKQVFVHDDPDLVDGFPARAVAGSTGGPAFAQLDGAGGPEMVMADNDGLVHAWHPDGSEAPGWPTHTEPASWWPAASPTAEADGIAWPYASILVGTPNTADLDGDGTPEVAVADLDGEVHVFEHDGTARPGFPVGIDRRFSTQDARNRFNRMKPGMVMPPVAADLDADGRLELVAGALDRHVYAWHEDGTPAAGFPVLLVDPAKVAAVDPVSHHVAFREDADPELGGEIVAAAAIGDLDGDGRPEIVIGAQEQYEEAPNYGPLPIGGGNTRLYAIRPDGAAHTDGPAGPGGPLRVGRHPNPQAYLPGWPVRMGMFQLDMLPSIGDGVNAPAAIGDLDGDGGPEVVATAPLAPLYVWNPDGTSAYGTDFLGNAVTASNAPGAGASSSDTPMMSDFGGPSLGRLDGDSLPDVAMPTAGLGRGADNLLPDKQSPADPHVTAWNGRTGATLAGFPQTAADVAFFVTPGIVDVDDDGHNEEIVGNGVYTIDAVRFGGADASGWPKLTGGWTVGTPGVGDWDGDCRAELAQIRRDGVLLVWHTRARASSLTEWPQYGRTPGLTANFSDLLAVGPDCPPPPSSPPPPPPPAPPASPPPAAGGVAGATAKPKRRRCRVVRSRKGRRRKVCRRARSRRSRRSRRTRPRRTRRTRRTSR